MSTQFIRYPIISERLILSPFRETDFEALCAMESDRDVKEFTGGVLDRDQTMKLLSGFIEANSTTGLGAIAIRRKGIGEYLGLCGLVRESDADEAEVFYGLTRSAWGHGYATEACRALIDAAFTQLQVSSVFAIPDLANGASIRVLERAGMQLSVASTRSEDAGHGSREYRIVKAAGASSLHRCHEISDPGSLPTKGSQHK